MPIEGWSNQEIGALGTVITGKTPSTKNDTYWQGDVPFITPPDLRGTRVRQAQRSITEDGLAVVNEIPRNAVMVCCIGSIGLTGICDAERAATNQQINSVIVDETRADARFCHYAIVYNRPALLTAAQMTTVPILNKSNFSRIRLWLPPLAEQQQIASVLFAAQRAIERQERLIALTAELKKALMHKLFTEGTRGEPVKQTEIGAVPESWEVIGLGSCCDLATGTTPPTAQPDLYVGTNAFIRTNLIVNARIHTAEEYVSDEALARYNLKKFPAGTVLMAMYGQGKTRGQVAILETPASITQNAAAVTCGSRVVPDFLYYYLMSQYERLRESGFAGQISHLNLGFVRGFLIPCPSTREQRRIADVLVTVETKENLHQSMRRAFKDLFCSLLDQLMTARIHVRDLDLSALEEAVQQSAEADAGRRHFAKMRPYMVDVADVDDSREAIYTRREGEGAGLP